jgi:hypothetical protein
MPEAALPANLHEFITQKVRSLEQLEILLLVARDRETEWTVQMVYDVILSTKPSVERWLDEFTRLGFLKKETSDLSLYRFAATDEIAGLIRDLGQFYKTKPVRVIEAIFKADRNPVQSFADAFRLKTQE